MEALIGWFDSADVWNVSRPWFYAALIVVVGWFVGRLLAALAARVLRRTGSEHLSSVSRRLLFYLVLLAAVFAALSQLGIQPGTLLTTAGLLTVAIGFAAQTSVANVISGLFLLVDRPFSINDTVKIDTTIGVVTAIDLLSTKVRTFDNLVVRVPNEALLKSTIINYSLHNVRRLEQTVTVSYASSLTDAVAILNTALERHALILDEPEPFVLVDQLGPNGVIIKVRAWCIREDYVQAKSELTIAIKDSLQSAGVEIPLPQMVVRNLES